MMQSSLSDSTVYPVFGNVRFVSMFARGHPLARALNETWVGGRDDFLATKST